MGTLGMQLGCLSRWMPNVFTGIVLLLLLLRFIDLLLTYLMNIFWRHWVTLNELRDDGCLVLVVVFDTQSLSRSFRATFVKTKLNTARSIRTSGTFISKLLLVICTSPINTWPHIEAQIILCLVLKSSILSYSCRVLVVSIVGYQRTTKFIMFISGLVTWKGTKCPNSNISFLIMGASGLCSKTAAISSTIPLTNCLVLIVLLSVEKFLWIVGNEIRI